MSGILAPSFFFFSLDTLLPSSALLSSGFILLRHCATTTTFSAWRRTRALTRSSARTGSSRAGITGHLGRGPRRDVVGVARAYEVADAIQRARRHATTRRYASDISGERGDGIVPLDDEVAIDFPVGRERPRSHARCLLRRRSLDGLSAEIVRHRSRGVRRRHACRSTCRSVGRVRGAAAAARPGLSGATTCGGLGEVACSHEMRVRVPAGVREGATFRFSVTPPGAPADGRRRPRQHPVIPHLTLLTVLHRVWGALGLLLGAVHVHARRGRGGDRRDHGGRRDGRRDYRGRVCRVRRRARGASGRRISGRGTRCSGASRTAASRRSRSACSTCSCCRSGPRSGSTRSGCSLHNETRAAFRLRQVPTAIPTRQFRVLGSGIGR